MLERVNVQLEIEGERALRRLGLSGDGACRRAKARFGSLLGQAKALARPAGLFCLAAFASLPPKTRELCWAGRAAGGGAAGAENTAAGAEKQPAGLLVCLASLGSLLSENVDQLFSQKDSMAAFTLDHLATELLFSLAEQVSHAAALYAQGQGLRLSAGSAGKLSPGENGLPLSAQALLYAEMVKRGPIPCQLTEGFMLVPAKSLLFAYPLESGPLEADLPVSPVQHDCAACANTDCYFRRALSR